MKPPLERITALSLILDKLMLRLKDEFLNRELRNSSTQHMLSFFYISVFTHVDVTLQSTGFQQGSNLK